MNNSITRNSCLGSSAQGAPGKAELGHVAQVFAAASSILFTSFPLPCSGIFTPGVCGPLRLTVDQDSSAQKVLFRVAATPLARATDLTRQLYL